MRRHNVGLFYALTFLTGGWFIVYWIFLLSKDVNFLRRRTVLYPTSQLVIAVLAIACNLFCVALLASKLSSGSFDPGMDYPKLFLVVSSLSLTISFCAMAAILDSQARLLLGEPVGAGTAITAAFLTLVFFVSFVRVQNKFNRLVEPRPP